MVNAYVLATGNTTVLERALPLLDAELEWWRVNRTISVTSPYTNKTHSVAHFAVNNTAPRPEVGSAQLAFLVKSTCGLIPALLGRIGIRGRL
jgi:hypothetical protein